jgi:hypothetical protein
MAICGCGLPAHCCQPAVAGGVIYADLWVELALTWPSRLCSLRVLCTMPLLQTFPFPSTLGEVTLHPLSQAGMFVYSSVGSGSSPSPVEFFSHRHFYKLSCSWLQGVCCCSCWLVCLFTAHGGSGSSPLSCGVFLPLPLSQAFLLWLLGAPILSGQAWLVYLQCSGRPTLLLHVFIVLIAYHSISLFNLGGGQSVQGAMLIWSRVVCVLLSSPCPRLPRPSEHR